MVSSPSACELHFRPPFVGCSTLLLLWKALALSLAAAKSMQNECSWLTGQHAYLACVAWL